MRVTQIVGNMFGIIGLLGLACTSAMILWLASERPNPEDGLSARYYRNLGFKGTSFKRTDPHLDFYWQQKAPMLGLRADRFSVIWKGCLTVPAPNLRLAIEADGAVSARVDGEHWLGETGPAPVRVVFSERPLSPGPHTVELHYQHKGEDSRFRAALASASGSLRTLSPHILRPGACK